MRAVVHARSFDKELSCTDVLQKIDCQNNNFIVPDLSDRVPRVALLVNGYPLEIFECFRSWMQGMIQSPFSRNKPKYLC